MDVAAGSGIGKNRVGFSTSAARAVLGQDRLIAFGTFSHDSAGELRSSSNRTPAGNRLVRRFAASAFSASGRAGTRTRTSLTGHGILSQTFPHFSRIALAGHLLVGHRIAPMVTAVKTDRDYCALQCLRLPLGQL